MRLPSLLPLAAFLLLAAAPYPGSVKWFCGGFEAADVKARFGACPGGRADKEVADAFGYAERARQQCIELINSGVSQKRLRYDQYAARRCLEAETGLSQDPRRSHSLQDTVRGSCAGVAVGLLKAGVACESSLDCAAPLVCIGAKGGPPGKCAKPLGEGQACDEELLGGSRFYGAATALRGLCARGLHCATTGELQCVKDLGAGAACDGADPAACGLGWRCVTGRCAAETLAAAGRACLSTADCGDGLFCSKGMCAAKKAAGAACSAAAECKGTCRGGHCQALCGSG